MQFFFKIIVSIFFYFSIFVVNFYSVNIFALDKKIDSTNQVKDLALIGVVPSGEEVSSSTKQIVLQFNHSMVPLSALEDSPKNIHIDISPNIHCGWHWINRSSLACELNHEDGLHHATKYHISVHPGIKSENGSVLQKEYKHTFTTERPRLSNMSFKEWLSPGTPCFKMFFNQPVVGASVKDHIIFSHSKNGSEVILPIKVKKYKKKSIRDGGEKREYFFDQEDDEVGKVWIVSPESELPLDSNILLKIIPGLKSSIGKELGIENRTLLSFYTFPEFEFLGIKCKKNDNESIFLTNDNNDEKCNPLSEISLVFSSPVSSFQKKNIAISSKNKKNYILDPEFNHYSMLHTIWNRTEKANIENMRYELRFNKFFDANETYYVQTKDELNYGFELMKSFLGIYNSDLEDEFGRKLKKPINFKFFTDNRLPNYNLAHNIAVLEKQVDSDVPLYITNINKVKFHYGRITETGVDKNLLFDIGSFEDSPRNISFGIPMRVRDMLVGKSGAVFGSIEMEPEVQDNREYLFIVSPYGLHMKLGHYNSLVWVTDLSTGNVVNDAKVQIYKTSENILSDPFILDEAVTDNLGVAMLKGSYELGIPGYYYEEKDKFFVRVTKCDDLAIMPLNERFKLYSFSFSNGSTIWEENREKYGHISSWGTTSQGVYRAGDVILYKFYVRDQSNNGFIQAPKEGYELEIIDPTGKIVQKVENIVLSNFGAYDGKYDLPKNAVVGWYKFSLKSKFIKDKDVYSSDSDRLVPIRVLVSDFSESSFKVSNDVNGNLFHPGDELEITSRAELYSGGPYVDAEIRVSGTLVSEYFSPADDIAKEFYFDSYSKNDSVQIFEKIDNTDNNGQFNYKLTLPKEDIKFGNLIIESAVRDNFGKYISTISKVRYTGVDYLVGLKRDSHYEAGKEAKIEYMVVNGNGLPVSDIEVEFNIDYLEIKMAKVKGAGNAYLTKYIDNWIPVEPCKETISKSTPSLCKFTPEKTGEYRIIAKVKDKHGNEHSTSAHIYAFGTDRLVWHESNDYSLQIIPQSKEYNIGDKASYLIKNPYPGSKALISIERYGVLKSWVQEFQDSTAIVEFEIEENFVPGFYLSVVVNAPRVESTIPELGKIDLGKPAFKIGYIEVPVRDPHKKIDISIKTGQKIYKPGDKVVATINAKKTIDKENIEFAVVVLNEAVLDLIRGGKSYFDPYDGFYKLGRLDLRNYNLITCLLGRQKFEKKGANSGGDGGTGISMRSLFKNMIYWNPSLIADKDGNIKVDFILPDNLTNWKILAFATTPTDKMGLADSDITVTRSTEINPVMPNHVNSGDIFKAGFSVTNKTDKERDIVVTASVSNNVENTSKISETIHLEPYKRKTVYIPVETSKTLNKNDSFIHFTAKASDNIDTDIIKYSVPVYKRYLLKTVSNYGMIEGSNIKETIKLPENITSEVRDISVLISPSVINDIDAYFHYIKDYPYNCWEQKLAKALMASYYSRVNSYLPHDDKWEESEALPYEILKQASNYQAPNGGMVYFEASDLNVDPYLSAYTAVAFNFLREHGVTIPNIVEAKLHSYLENLLKNDVFPALYSYNSSITVRAVALAALSKHQKISLSDLERYRPYIEYMNLFGKSHYLQALLNVGGSDDTIKELLDLILSSSVQSSGDIRFNEINNDNYILNSKKRTDCCLLSTILQYKAQGHEISAITDLPSKLVRSITQNFNTQPNTQEAVFCVKSLLDYSNMYENQSTISNKKDDTNIIVTINGNKFGNAVFKNLKSKSARFNYRPKDEDINKNYDINISRTGNIGIPLYYTTSLKYESLDNPNSINSGIEINREYRVKRDGKWLLISDQDEIKIGDLVKIDIYVFLPTERYFVIVSDPVPGGLEPLNRELATTSNIDVNVEDKFETKNLFSLHEGDNFLFPLHRNFHSSTGISRNFYHSELKHDYARFYSNYLASGKYHLSYVAQAIIPGTFTKMPVYAEEMYNPDIFGSGEQGTLKIISKK